MSAAELLEKENAPWPYRLARYAAFHLGSDSTSETYIALAWLPEIRTLWAQKIELGKPPPRSRMPVPIVLDGTLRPQRVSEDVLARHIRQITLVPVDTLDPRKLAGFSPRTKLLNALLMVDPSMNGDESRYLLDTRIFIDSQYRGERIRSIATSLDAGPGLRPQLLELLTAHIWWCGMPQAMLRRNSGKGGAGSSRHGVRAKKPGPLSAVEKSKKAAMEAKGKTFVRTDRRTNSDDVGDILNALTEHWASNLRISLRATYYEYRREMRARKPEETPLQWWPFYRNATTLIQQRKLDHLRNGPKLTAQYGTPRAGNSSDMTWGSLQILDMDGWEPKVGVSGWVTGKYQRLPRLTVILAVCRLSGAIVGYEIELDAEKGQSYKFCALSALSNKRHRARELGVTKGLSGLVHGNFDAVFVDNGPGTSKKMRAPIVDHSIAGAHFVPAPGRGELKPLIESINGRLAELMAEAVDGAYSRKQDPLSKEKRRAARHAKPLGLLEFEQLLLEIIIYLNRTRDCSHLRDSVMAENGVGIHPYAIFSYIQRHRRRGDAAIQLREKELLDAIICWEPRQCRDGTVQLHNLTFSSQELRNYAGSLSPKDRRSFRVEAKRTGPSSKSILCRIPNGTIFELMMTDECQRMHGSASWKMAENLYLDINASNAAAEDERSTLKPSQRTRKNSPNAMTRAQHETIRDIEQGRGNQLAVKNRRKSNAQVASGHSAIEQRQRDSYNVVQNADESFAQDSSVNMDAVEDDPIAIAARKIEAENLARWESRK
ncbi:hypothetical protein [Pandoraea apista]|uniref:hypothetical protein n=1 Tax=Pandoraea apista TaxID=93218 RepID=UPI00248DC67F|nr:hypothetical protein [Pandoraea apista]